MAEKSIVKFLESQVAENFSRKNSYIDMWLHRNPDKKDDLDEAIAWFSENRSAGFGWSALQKSLSKIDGWSDFPPSARVLRHWALRNYPDLF